MFLKNTFFAHTSAPHSGAPGSDLSRSETGLKPDPALARRELGQLRERTTTNIIQCRVSAATGNITFKNINSAVSWDKKIYSMKSLSNNSYNPLSYPQFYILYLDTFYLCQVCFGENQLSITKG